MGIYWPSRPLSGPGKPASHIISFFRASSAFNSLFNLPSRQKALNVNLSTTVRFFSFFLFDTAKRDRIGEVKKKLLKWRRSKKATF